MEYTSEADVVFPVTAPKVLTCSNLESVSPKTMDGNVSFAASSSRGFAWMRSR